MLEVNHLAREGQGCVTASAWCLNQVLQKELVKHTEVYRPAKITSLMKARPNPLSNPASIGSIPTAGCTSAEFPWKGCETGYHSEDEEQVSTLR